MYLNRDYTIRLQGPVGFDIPQLPQTPSFRNLQNLYGKIRQEGAAKNCRPELVRFLVWGPRYRPASAK